MHNGLRSTVAFQHSGMATFASPEEEQGIHAEKKGDNGGVDAAKQADEASTADNEAAAQSEKTGFASESQHTSETVKRRRQGTKRTAFSDSDSEGDMDDLTKEDLVKLVCEKKEILENKQKEFDEWKDKVLRKYAEMENIMERTRRDAENTKKFAVQV